MKKVIILLLTALMAWPVMADEGMWIPMLLNRNEADMQVKGMRISAKDIYDINQASLKDAIILFNQGCTGEFVSSEGLFLTNHHCGYSYIVSHSTVEHDYLTNGFWAMSREQELPCPGLTATRLVRMEDVTQQVLEGIAADANEETRSKLIAENIKKVGEAATQGTHYKYVIKPFYYGNQYFIYINEVFTDVRLVGAPPSNIGKFGGDTDNWMWPRHTGDFSMFRVYVGKDSKPATYSKDNVPYQPLKHLEISLKGLNEGDFTFVFGYPGTTQRYVTSDAVKLAAEETNPIRIGLRDIRLKHYNEAMKQSPAQRLKYASKVASIANGWKKWQGESLGIARLDGVQQKKEFESRFQAWANDKPEYRDVLAQLLKNYEILAPIELERTYFNEAVLASDLMSRAFFLWERAYDAYQDTQDAEEIQQFANRQEKYFSDFPLHRAVDSAIFMETMLYAWQHGYAPYIATHADLRKVETTLANIFNQSILTRPDKLQKALSRLNNKRAADKLYNDPAIALVGKAYNTLYSTSLKDEPRYIENHEEKWEAFITAYNEIQRLMRTYVKGIMEMQPEVNFFPDANLTLRVAYGAVQGFRPNDGVYYRPYSTLKGIMEKENPDIYDYVVEPRLKELYNNKDYGRYADASGNMPACFIATNHTTGGNSGSPVLNGDGQLVGINFDRCWEGTMSDLLFDPDYCRNISLDIRYCLFIIDKFAGAGHLVDEMTIVQ